MTNFKLAAFAAALVTLGSTAGAAVVSGAVTGGTAVSVFQLIPNPPEVGDDSFQSPDLFAFDELQGYTLTDELNIGGGNTIAAGTVVDSHYVFFDPAPATRVMGTVEFSGTILGVVTKRRWLEDSDFLGAVGTDYKSPANRGLENPDIFSVSGSVLTLNWNASHPGDHIRVLTEAAPVPLPAGGLLLLSGLGALIARRRAK